MKAFFSAVQLSHKPQRYLSKGNMVHYPDQPERAKRLLQGVRKAGCNVHASRSFETSFFSQIHSPRYLDFLENGYEQWLKLGSVHQEMMPSIRPAPGPCDYSDHILGKAGWHLSDFSCPVVGNTWEAAKASANTALSAAQAVADGEKNAYALCRPPGHHAQQERAGGFCYLNNSAIAAQYLRNTHDTVAILDIDVHHGNGTQQIFYPRRDVYTVSLHGDPNEYYPFFQGFESQVGKGEGEGFNLNLPVPVKSGDDVWMTALETALIAINDYDPGVLVLALGLDAHEADPLEGGAVTENGFYEMADLIKQLNLPTVIVQEGGYLTPYLGDNLASFILGFENTD